MLILLLRSRIQQAGAQGLAEMLTQLAELSVIWSDALHPQLLTGEGASAESIEDAALARSNALAALLDHEGVMADIRGITLSNSAALRLQVRDVERALSAPRPADALAPESVRQQLADLEARGALPLAAFREAQESAERLQVWARETLGDLAPDFHACGSCWRYCLTWYRQPRRKFLRRQRQTPQARLWIMPFRHGQRMCRLSTRPRYIPPTQC